MFCGDYQRSEFWDEIEEHIMECRDKASPERRGELEASDMRTSPIRCETEALSRASLERVVEEQAA